MSVQPVANPLAEAHRQSRIKIPQLFPSEIEARLVAFSLREIERAEQRINSIPQLSPREARDLYYRLLRAFVVEHGAGAPEAPVVRRAA